MAKKNEPTLHERRLAFEAFRCRIRTRPTCPSLVGRTGTAVADTLDEQIRVEVDLREGEQWARTILVLPEDIQPL